MSKSRLVITKETAVMFRNAAESEAADPELKKTLQRDTDSYNRAADKLLQAVGATRWCKLHSKEVVEEQGNLLLAENAEKERNRNGKAEAREKELLRRQGFIFEDDKAPPAGSCADCPVFAAHGMSKYHQRSHNRLRKFLGGCGAFLTGCFGRHQQ